jgi:hypothetical protein
MRDLSFAYNPIPVNSEATILGFQRDLQPSHQKRGDPKKRVVAKEPKDSIPATIPIPHYSCPPPFTTPVEQDRFSMISLQVSLLPPSKTAACQAPSSQSRVPLSGKSPIELVFPALITVMGADPEETLRTFCSLDTSLYLPNLLKSIYKDVLFRICRRN